MHENELHTNARLVRRLLARQLLRWSDLPIERIASSGTMTCSIALATRRSSACRASTGPWVDGDEDFGWLPKFAPLSPPTLSARGPPGDDRLSFESLRRSRGVDSVSRR
jgi:hypothetical protein